MLKRVSVVQMAELVEINFNENLIVIKELVQFKYDFIEKWRRY